MDDPVFPTHREPPESRTTHEHGPGTERERTHDVRPPSNSPVHQDFDPARNRIDHFFENVGGWGDPVELTTAVVRNDDGCGAMIAGEKRVFRREKPLDDHGEPSRRTEMLEVGPGHARADGGEEIFRPAGDLAAESGREARNRDVRRDT